MNSQGGRSGTNSRGSYNSEGRTNFYGGGGRNAEDQAGQRGGGRGNYESPTWTPENVEPASGGGGGGFKSNNNFTSRGGANSTWNSNNGGGQRQRSNFAADVPPRFQNQLREESYASKNTSQDESTGNGRPFYQMEPGLGKSEAKKSEESRTPISYQSNRGSGVRTDSQNSSWSNEDTNTRNAGRDQRSGGPQMWGNSSEDKRNTREDRSGENTRDDRSGGARNEFQRWNKPEDTRNTREDRSGGGGRNESQRFGNNSEDNRNGGNREDRFSSGGGGRNDRQRYNSSEDNRNGENKSRGFSGGGGRDRSSGFNDSFGGRNENSSYNRSENQRPAYNRDENRKPWSKDDSGNQWQPRNNDDKPYNRDRNQAGSTNFRNGNDSGNNNSRWNNRDSAPKQQENNSWNSAPKTNAVEVNWDSEPAAAAATTAVVRSAATQVSQVKIEVGDLKEISVVYAVTPEEFYCNLVDFKTQGLYREMSEKLNKVCGDESSCKKLENCSVGAICAACFSEDRVWYRAKILSIAGAEATIMFIDYGNGDVCALDSLKVLEPELANLPARAIKCGLFNVKPEGKVWSDDEADYFEGVVTKAHYYARFLAQNQAKDGFIIDMVDSYSYGDLSLRFQLMTERKVVPRSTSDEVYAQLASSALKDQTAFTRRAPALEVGAKFTAYVSWVNFPGEFYARDLKAEEEWSRFDAKLNAAYAALTANEFGLTELEKGKPCVTPFTCDGAKAWYRALILAVEEEHVVVAYVDFGNVERVQFHEVKSIKPEFTELPAQAMLLNVANLKPMGSHWKSVSQADLGKYLAGDLECEVKAVGEHYYVVDASVGEKNVATRMIEDGLAYFEEDHCYAISYATQAVVEKILLSSQVKSVEIQAQTPTEIASPPITPSGETSSLSSASSEILAPAEIRDKTSVETIKESEKEASVLEPAIGISGIERGFKFGASVSFVNGLDSFYLQRASDFTRLDDLSALLNSAFADSEPEEATSWKVGEMCVARYELDQAWYRALIREQQDFGFRLLFVDYGNIEFVTFDQIRSVPASWSRVPYLALRCRLHALNEEVSEEQREEVAAALNEILNGSESLEVEVKLIEEDVDSERLFWLDVSCAGEDVAEELREKFGIAAAVEVVEEAKPENQEIKPESEDEKPEIEDEKPEIEDEKPEIEDEKPEIEDEKPEIVEKKSESEDQKLEIDEKKPETQKIKSETEEIKPETEEIKPETEEIKPETEEIKPKTEEIKLESEEKKSETVKFVNAKAMQCVLGEKVEVCVSFIESPDCFWLQKVSDAKRLETLLEELAVSCGQVEEEEKAAAAAVGEMSVNDLYAVKFSEDDGWYRGQVESVDPEGGGANLFFVDFGNCEVFEKGSARVQQLAKEEWRETAFFAVQCKLRGDVWSEEAQEAFKINYENKTCLAEFLERRNEDGVYEVRLLDMGLDVAQVIAPVKEEANEEEVESSKSASPSSVNESSSADSSSINDESLKCVSSSSVSVSSSAEDSMNESSVPSAEAAVAVDEFNKSLVVPSYDEFAENASVHPRSESTVDLSQSSCGGEVQVPSIESSQSEAVLTEVEKNLPERVEPVSTSEVAVSKNEAAESFIAERLGDLDSKESSVKEEKVGSNEDAEKLKNEDESDDSSTLENTSAGDLEVNSAELLKDEESVPVAE